MEQFPHLKFVQKLTGKPRFQGGGEEHPTTRRNKENREAHSGTLTGQTNSIRSDWNNSFKKRDSEGLADIDDSTTPVFLQVNPDIINPEFDLESFGIEIISEEEDGYIIGASFDNLRTLDDKLQDFIASKHGSGRIADLWQIIDGNRETWKPEYILSEKLYAEWSKIKDDQDYHLEVSVAFAKPLGQEPDPAKKGGRGRLRKYQEQQAHRDELLLERQEHFESFILHYGELMSSFVELEDCFACEVQISGKGLKDLVINYQFVFEVSEVDEVTGITGLDSEIPEAELEIQPPEEGSIEIGVIDSGIMEGNKFISPAIISDNSKSYIDGDDSTADHVKGGGHGTKVASAILYPKGLSHLTSPYTLPCYIRNIRILDEDNALRHSYPASLMESIIDENVDCEIFNLSICSNAPFRTKHMSTWAAIIDKLVFDNDVLFVIASGNIRPDVIRDYVANGNDYPEYLFNKSCRLANPSQSCFSISVGSINHCSFEDDEWISLGGEDDISPFSRIGPGIWDTIKPDVVEYGGGLIVSKNGSFLIRRNEDTSIELVRSTLHGGSAIGRDGVGTSYSTPKVAHLAAILKQLYPVETSNLIRAFITQGARLPNDLFSNPTKAGLQSFGYGLPSIERVTKNSEHRITFYNTGTIIAEEGHIYSLGIPEELRGQGDEYDILLEVTLAYSARIRRTRQKTKSYLSTWLEWKTSKIGETYDKFKDYVLKEIDGEVTTYEVDERKKLHHFDWKIKSRTDFGVQDYSRNNSSLQKDWAIEKSYNLPEEISFAVLGHKGWDKNKMEIPYAITVSIEILGTEIPIYEDIRIENEVELEVELSK